MLSEALGDDVDVTLIDKSDAFVFGFSKLDVMFGRTTPEAVRLPYRDIAKPGVRFLRETITAIDPEARRVTTDAGVHEADVLVGRARRRLRLRRDARARRRRQRVLLRGRAPSGCAEIIPTFSEGHAIVGVCGAPFKCPPAPSECALLLHDELTARGVRDDCGSRSSSRSARPVPPSPDTSAALAAEFAERDITLDRRPPHQLARPGAQRRGARRRHRAAVRPLPRRARSTGLPTW